MLTAILLIAAAIFALYIAYSLIVGGVAIIALFGDVIIFGLLVALFVVLIKKVINH